MPSKYLIVKIAPPSLLISENYRNEDLLKLLNQFSDFVDEKAIVQWPSFLHHVQRESLSQSKDAVELLQCIVKDQFFNRGFPEIQNCYMGRKRIHNNG